MSKTNKKFVTVTRDGWLELVRCWADADFSRLPQELLTTALEMSSRWFTNKDLASMCRREASLLEPGKSRRLGTATAVGWFLLVEGNVLVGRLLGGYERRDPLQPLGTSRFYQVELLRTARVRAGWGEEARNVVARAGEVVNVNFGPKTRAWDALLPEIQAGAEYEVGVRCKDKVPLTAGRSVHDMDVFARRTKEPDPDLLREDRVEELLERIGQLREQFAQDPEWWGRPGTASGVMEVMTMAARLDRKLVSQKIFTNSLYGKFGGATKSPRACGSRRLLTPRTRS